MSSYGALDRRGGRGGSGPRLWRPRRLGRRSGRRRPAPPSRDVLEVRLQPLGAGLQVVARCPAAACAAPAWSSSLSRCLRMKVFGCRSSSWMSVPSSRLRSLVALRRHPAQVAQHPQAVADHLGQPVAEDEQREQQQGRRSPTSSGCSNTCPPPPAVPAPAYAGVPPHAEGARSAQFASAASVTDARRGGAAPAVVDRAPPCPGRTCGPGRSGRPARRWRGRRTGRSRRRRAARPRRPGRPARPPRAAPRRR